MSRRRGFTLLELLTVIAMLTVLTGALSSAVASARRRTHIVRADAEVHEIANAILAYENISEDKSLNGHAMSDQEATEKNLGFILGDGGKTAGGEKIPVLFNGAVSSDGKLHDPWGTPYHVSIEVTQESPEEDEVGKELSTILYLPNFYRLGESERQ